MFRTAIATLLMTASLAIRINDNSDAKAMATMLINYKKEPYAEDSLMKGTL